MAVNSVMQLVLYVGIKLLRDGRVFVIVNAALAIDVGDFLMKAPLRSPDFPDSLQQFIKVIFAKQLIALLEAVIIKRKTFDKKLTQDAGGPLPELGGLQ